MKQPFIVGILGGMGPMAGVLLQERIIQATPATSDQDHLDVITYTKASLPDRSTSLAMDGGASFFSSFVDAAKTLESAGVSVLVIACNTAHIRVPELQLEIGMPILSLIEETSLAISALPSQPKKVGLFGTTALVNSGLYQNALKRYGIDTLTPDATDQKKCLDLIYSIKAGQTSLLNASQEMQELIAIMRTRGADGVILGCTELSLLRDHLDTAFCIDPVDVISERLVELQRQTQASTLVFAEQPHARVQRSEGGE